MWEEYEKSSRKVWEECKKSMRSVEEECKKSVRRVREECKRSVIRVWEECKKSVIRVREECKKSVIRVREELEKSMGENMKKCDEERNVEEDTLIVDGSEHNVVGVVLFYTTRRSYNYTNYIRSQFNFPVSSLPFSALAVIYIYAYTIVNERLRFVSCLQ